MIIYSVTVTIRKDAESDWLRWMKEIHIPYVMNTGYFFDWQIQKLILPENSIDEITYVINYLAQSFEKYQQYVGKDAHVCKMSITRNLRTNLKHLKQFTH